MIKFFLAIILASGLFAEENFFEANRKKEVALTIESAKGKSAKEVLAIVNDTINAYPYKSDVVKKDEWVGLKALIARGVGDCEDYAISKGELLKTIFPDLQSYVLVGKGHARLLVITQESEVFVLDNQNKLVLPIEKNDLKDLKLLSFDDPKVISAINTES